MQKVLFILTLCLTLAFKVGGQSIKFQKTINGINVLQLFSVHQTRDGGYIGAGYAQVSSTTGGTDCYVVKTDSTGKTLWSRMFGGSSDDDLAAVREMADGSFIATGNRVSGFDFQMVISRLSATGNVLWHKVVDVGPYESGQAVAGVGGGYLFAGYAMAGNAASGYLLKTDSMGNVGWTRLMEIDTEASMIYSAEPTSDGGLLLAGRAGYNGSADVWLIKTDQNGNVSWMKRYNGPAGDDIAYAARQTADGGYIVAGKLATIASDSFDAFLMKVDANGTLMWAKQYGFAYEDVALGVDICRDGGFITTGVTHYLASTPGNGFAIKTNDTGKVLWSKMYGGANAEYMPAVERTKDNGFIFAGSSESFGTPPIYPTMAYLVKTDSAGASGCNQVDTAVSGLPVAMVNIAVTAAVSSVGTATPLASSPGNLGISSTLCTTVGVDEQKQLPQAFLAPNPANTLVQVKADQLIKEMALTNIAGSVVYQHKAAGALNISVDIAGYPAGMYFYCIRIGEKLFRGKLIISR